MNTLINSQIYIVFDGTSHYAIYGSDWDPNEEEIVKGPYNDWNDEVEDMVTKLNDEAYGTHMYR